MLIPFFLYAQSSDLRKTEAEISIEDQFIAAKSLVISGKKTEAIKLLDSLRRVISPNATIYFELAKLYHTNKDINQTESNLKQAVQLDPTNIWIRKWEVDFAIELGRYDEAIKTLQHLILLQPKSIEFYDRIAKINLSLKNYSKALQILEMKEKNVGWSVDNTIMKAQVLEADDRMDDCISVLKTLTTRYPLEKKYYRLIVNTLHANDKMGESELYLKKILEIDPNDHDAKLGLLLLKKGKGGREDYFTTLMPLISNPDVPLEIKIKELLPHVQQHATKGDTILGNQLIQICDKLVITHPNDAKAHAIYADVLKNNGNYIAAIRQYEKTLKINNKNYTVWEQLMFCQLFAEQMDALAITSNEAIDFFPNQAISYYFYAKALIANQDLKKAESTLSEGSLIAAGNPDLDSRIKSAIGEISLIKKDYGKAKSFAEQVLLASGGRSIEASELMGDIYNASGDVKNTAIYYQKSYDLGNRSKSFLRKLNGLKTN